MTVTLLCSAVVIAVSLTLFLDVAADSDSTWQAQGWWYRGGAMRTISPLCNGWSQAGTGGKQKLQQFLEEMAADGVAAVVFNAIYRADVATEPLWCGLAGGEYKSPNTFAFDSTNDAKAFVASAHAKGIAVLSWMNPSYIYTGSSMFKATQSVNCCNNGSASGCQYYDWKARSSKYPNQPDDSKLKGVKVDSFVNGKTCAYYSFWGAQPTTDWRSSAWVDEWKSIAEVWLHEVGIDGFVFDYPDAYHPYGWDAGKTSLYTPSVYPEKITGPVTGSSIATSTKAAFGELYAAPDRAALYGLTASLADDAASSIVSGGGSRDDGKNWNIQHGNAEALDTFFGVTLGKASGGIDSFTALCRYRNAGKTGVGCTVPWTRVGVTTVSSAAKANRLSVAIPLLGGAFVAVEYVDKVWWSESVWAGSDSLRSIYAAVQRNTVLQPLMLRAPLCFQGSGYDCKGNTAQSKGLYGMFRWDPFISGQIALVIFNLADTAVTAKLDLHSSLVNYFLPGGSAADLLTGKALTKLAANYDVEVPAQDVVVIGGDGLRHGRRWSMFPGKNYNCNYRYGAVWPSIDQADVTQFLEEVSLAQCLVLCASNSNCDTVTVRWGFKDDAIISTLNGCWLRKVPDITKCYSKGSDDGFTYHSYSMSASDVNATIQI